MKNKHAKITFKVFMTVLISFFAHLYYVFTGQVLSDSFSWFTSIMLKYNSFSMYVIYVIIGIFSCVMLQSIYSKKWEWLKYAPIYVTLLTLTSLPNGTMRSFITVVFNEILSSFLPPVAVFFAVFIFRLIVFSALMFGAEGIVELIRMTMKKRVTDGCLTCGERRKKGKVLLIVLKCVLVMMLAVPICALLIKCISYFLLSGTTETSYDPFYGIGVLGVFGAIIFVVGAVFSIIWTFAQIAGNVLLHKNYRSFLKYSPLYVTVWFVVLITKQELVAFVNPVVNDVLVFEPFLSHTLYDNIYFSSAFYVLQWFALISLAFAVKAFITYCNRQFVKESLEGKGSI